MSKQVHRLTPRMVKFIAAYTGNITEAARAAGYTGTDNTLCATGRNLLEHPLVAAELASRTVVRDSS